MWPANPAVKNPVVMASPPTMAAALCEKRLRNQLHNGPVDRTIECNIHKVHTCISNLITKCVTGIKCLAFPSHPS